MKKALDAKDKKIIKEARKQLKTATTRKEREAARFILYLYGATS